MYLKSDCNCFWSQSGNVLSKTTGSNGHYQERRAHSIEGLLTSKYQYQIPVVGGFLVQ
jgi:hypothetical protein